VLELRGPFERCERLVRPVALHVGFAVGQPWNRLGRLARRGRRPQQDRDGDERRVPNARHQLSLDGLEYRARIELWPPPISTAASRQRARTRSRRFRRIAAAPPAAPVRAARARRADFPRTRSCARARGASACAEPTAAAAGALLSRALPPPRP